MQLTVGADRIVAEPAVKSSQLTIPLSTSSAHPAHVHRSWPVALCKRLSTLSTCPSSVGPAKLALVRKFKSQLADPATIHLLERDSRDAVQRSLHDQGTVWLKLGFHPALNPSIPRAIRKFMESSSNFLRIRHLIPNLKVAIAWRNQLPALATSTRESLLASRQVGWGRR